MKKANLTKIIVLAAASGALFSCAGNNDSKNVDSASDFLEVASASDLKISSINILSHKLKSADTATSGTSLKLSVYNNNNCTAAGKVSYEGKDYSLGGIVYNLSYGEGKNQEFYIDTQTKKGTAYDGSDNYRWYVEMVKDLIDENYESIRTIYDDFKSCIGKSAEELGYTSYTLRRSIATNVAGYVFHGFAKDGAKEIETYRYITLDKKNDNWVFTSYSERIATTSVDEKGYSSTIYDVSESTFETVDAYSDLVVNLSDYMISGETTGAETLTIPSTGVLSGK